MFESSTGGSFDRAVALFEQGLALLSSEEIGPIDVADLGANVKRIRGLIDRLEAQCARRIEQFDKYQGFGVSGDTSTTNWLRNNCKMSGFSADKHVKLARRLPKLEATQTALESGAIGIEHALEIARATEDLGAAAETELLVAAKVQDPAELRHTAKQIRHRLDAVGMAREALAQFRKRRLHLYELADGMLGLDGALPAEGGAALRRCLESLIGTPPKDDERSQQQRQADALLELCGRQLDSGRLPVVNGRKPHVTVVVQAATLAGEPGSPAAELEGAGPLSGETAKRLLCGGSASVLTVDEKSAPLDLGRTRRLATEAQRRALVARDKHCRWPGCSWEARFCEAHHLDAWSVGGATNVRRMVLLCKSKHHPLVHEGGWRLVEGENGRLEARPPDGRPP
jgi:hypothetical protein